MRSGKHKSSCSMKDTQVVERWRRMKGEEGGGRGGEGGGGGKGRGRGVTSPARKSARRRSLEETALLLSLAAASAADMAGDTCSVYQAGFDLKHVFGFAAAAAVVLLHSAAAAQ
jgi:hypothetical protein